MDASRDTDARIQRPIVLLPGLCSPAEVMRPLRLRLERRLRRPTRIVSLGAACGDIRDLAEKTHGALEEAFASQPGTRVDVIGHSMGGLVAAYLLKCLDHGARIRRVVTLGTPHRGLAIGRLGYLLPGPIGRTLRQLRPGSSLLELVARLALPDDSELISIAGLEDAIVPAGATRLPDLAGQRSLEIAADHLGLVFTKRAVDALVGVLEASAERHPARVAASRPARAFGSARRLPRGSRAHAAARAGRTERGALRVASEASRA